MITLRWRQNRRPVFILTIVLFLIITFLTFDPRFSRRFTTLGGGSKRGIRSTAVVVAALEKDDVKWLESSEWDTWVYQVDNPRARHKVPQNKGHEAMVYLTHIIEQYDNLPQRLVFVHASRYQWHNDDLTYDGKRVLWKLRTDTIDSEGYVSLRCRGPPGCAVRPYIPSKSQITWNITDPDLSVGQVLALSYPSIFPDRPLPIRVGAPCCSQFAVTASTIRRRPKEDYIRARDWLMKTDLEDHMSGRVFEYSWHILFGKPDVYCPDEAVCYCRNFGKCGLKCEGGDCGLHEPSGSKWTVLWWKISRHFTWDTLLY